ncbi:hypothetical protein ACHAXS_001354 [Conticribra weissflogii]
MDKASTTRRNNPLDESDCNVAARDAPRSNSPNPLGGNQRLAEILPKKKPSESCMARETTESICRKFEAIQEKMMETMPGVRPFAVNPAHRLIARSLQERDARREGPNGLDRLFSSWSRQAVERNFRRGAVGNETKKKGEDELEDVSETLKRKSASSVVEDEPEETAAVRKRSVFSKLENEEWSQDELERLLNFANRWDPCNRNERSRRWRKRRRVDSPSMASVATASPLEPVTGAAVELVDNDETGTGLSK